MIQLKKMPGDWEEAVCQREKEEAGKGGILLYGSSHFAVWKEEWLARQMAPYRLYNRAFGGSTAEEALYYYPRLVRPAAPRALLYYEGDNDIPLGYTPGEIWELTRRVLAWARYDAGGRLPVVLLGLKHAPARAAFRPFQDEYNALLRAAAEEDPDIVYVDQAPFLEDGEGHVKTDLYSDDLLHLNETGYACVATALKDALERLGVRP